MLKFLTHVVILTITRREKAKNTIMPFIPLRYLHAQGFVVYDLYSGECDRVSTVK